MKQVTVWLNEKEFKHFEAEAQRREMSNYSLAKHLILFGIADDKASELLNRLAAQRQVFEKKQRLPKALSLAW
jgi:hypothetical protein